MSLAQGLRVSLVPCGCELMMSEAKAHYAAIVLGATGNVGGRIVHLLIENRYATRS